jgi:hypothetical protein
LVEVDVVVVEVLVVVDVVLVVVVGGGAVDVVLVVVDVGGTVVVVVIGVVLVLLVAELSPPLSEAITTTATISPITAATRSARAHLTPRLMPPPGGCPAGGGWSGWPM